MASARCTTLVTVKLLKEIVSSKPANHRILDASWHLPNAGRDGKVEFFQQHIPGAAFFDITDCAEKDTTLPHMVPTAKMFEDYVGSLGINNDTQVIVYDNNAQYPLFSAQRLWWTFRLFGHSKISLLEGGLPKWLSEGGTVTDQVDTVQRQTFTAKLNPRLLKHYEDIERNISAPEFTLVDARPEGRFLGKSPEPRPDIKPGAIPGSLNIPFMSLMNMDDRTFKGQEEIKAIFQKAGVDLEKPLAVSCGTGVSACVVALGAFLCGKEDVSVYDGAWTEWYLRAPEQLKENVP